MKTVEGWENKKLIDLAYFINGYAFKPDDWSKEGLPIIRIEQLKNAASISDYYAGKLPERNIINNDDLIFSWSASLFLKIWKHGKAALNQHLFKVTEKDGFNRLFIKYLIEFYLPEFAKSAHGSTMQHITRKELERFSVLVPLSIQEQTKIAEILSCIDTAIEQTEAMIAKQQRIKTGLMQDLLSKGIDEHGNIRTEQTHAFKDSELGRIPVEWEIKTISQTCNICNNLRKPISALERDLIKGHYPYYGATGIIDYLNEYRIDGKYALIGEDGDHFLKFLSQEMTLLITGKNNVNNHAHLLQGKENCLTEWFYLFFLHRDITYHLTRQGAGRFKLNKAALLELLIAIPELEEQKRIWKFLCSFKFNASNHEKELSKLKRQKTALMQNLLSGNVRVNQLIEN